MGRTRSRAASLMLLGVLLVSCIGCDQATKRLATEELRGRAPQSFLCDTVRLQHAENPGAFLGMGGRLPETLRRIAITGLNIALVAGSATVLIVHWNMPRPQFVALALLTAGGFGNLIDRVLHNGMVTDFLNVGIGPVRTGIFNVADMAITGGAIVLAAAALLDRARLAESASPGRKGR